MLDAKALEASRAAYQSAIPDGAWHANGGETDAPIRAAITAYIQAVGPEPAVAVRPLEWRDLREHTFPPMWSASTVCGVYDIEERCASDTPAYVVLGPLFSFIADKDSLVEAKAAAEADYASRIRSALVPTPPAEPVVEAKEPEAVADEIRALSKRLLSLSEELDPHLPSTHDPAFIDDLRYGADILLSLATIDSFYARSAFKAGWRTNADNVTHDRDYMDGCEEADWQEFLARGLRKYLEYVAQPSDEAALATPPAEPVVVEEWREIEQHVQPRLADGYTAVAISKPGFWMVKGPGPAAALATKPAVKDDETVVDAARAVLADWDARLPDGPEVHRTNHDLDFSYWSPNAAMISAEVMSKLRAALAAKDGRS